ncbi:MAG: hypothetical protein IJF27_05040, partial [Oscillospiraceae bacterium]|nr:hypothetical protein [Oscillospiraceae bacterium]
MNKRVKLITAVLLVAIILTLCACSAMDEKNNNIKEVVQKEGINEDIEKVLEIIDEERAEELYGRLKAEITSADANKEQSVLSLLGAEVSDQKTVV